MPSKNKQNYLLTPQSLFACDKFSLAEKVVLARAMSFGNHRYYESVEKTASFLGISESVVEKARAKFIKLGYFKKVGYSNNRVVYEVCDDIIEKDCQVRRITKNDISFCPKQSQNMQPTIAESAISQNDTYIYNNKEDNKDITPLTPLRGAVAVQKVKNDEKEEVDNIFNLWLSCFGLSGRKLTPGRQVKIRRRLKDCGKEQLELAIQNASQDYFYRGDNDRGWQADIDYICRSAEIVERLANMTPRAEKKLTWWERKQKEEDEEREERIRHPKYDEFGREARSDEEGNLVYV
jgi:hypothetical protein